MAAELVCQSIFGLVSTIKEQAERMDALKEDARKLHRYLKRVEAVVSDLQPYYNAAQQQAEQQAQQQPEASSIGADGATPPAVGYAAASQVLAGLHGVQAALSEVQELLETACSRGKLSSWLQADRLLQQFQAAAAELECSVGQLPCSQQLLGSAYEETADQIDALRSTLQRVRFELEPPHAHQLVLFRAACDSLQAPVDQLTASCANILQQVCGHSSLTREEFAAAVADLQREVRQLQAAAAAASGQHPTRTTSSRTSTSSTPSAFLLSAPTEAPTEATASGSAPEGVDEHQQQQQQQQQRDEFYLRMMCDLLRVAHQQQDSVPLEFICPITTSIMHDPVLIHETGHSYERQAIDDWFASGHKICPKSGTSLKKGLNISPNHALRAAIRTWSESCDLQLRFRPLLGGSSSSGAAQAESGGLFTPAFGAPQDQDGKPLPAAMTAGRLDTILGQPGTPQTGSTVRSPALGSTSSTGGVPVSACESAQPSEAVAVAGEGAGVLSDDVAALTLDDSSAVPDGQLLAEAVPKATGVGAAALAPAAAHGASEP